LRARSIPCERIFTVSAHEYAQAREASRAPAAWNETEALRATLEAHADSHMQRLERRAKQETVTKDLGRAPPPKRDGRGSFLGRLLGKGR